MPFPTLLRSRPARRFGAWICLPALLALSDLAPAALPMAGETLRGNAVEHSPAMAQLASQIETGARTMCQASGGQLSYIGDTSVLPSIDKMDVDFRVSRLRAATYRIGHALAGSGPGGSICQLRILTLHSAIFETFQNGQYIKVEADLDRKTGKRYRRTTPQWLTEYGPARRKLLEQQGFSFVDYRTYAGYRCAHLKRTAPLLNPEICLLDDSQADAFAQGLTLYGQNEHFGQPLPPDTTEVISVQFGVPISDQDLEIPADLKIKDMP